MTVRTINLTYQEFTSFSELQEEDVHLLQTAIKALSMSYSPYSRFRVGAAALLANGKIFTGNNQENAAYPSGLCAERVAVFSASSQYPGVPIVTLAIVASADCFTVTEPAAPCGACRQVMAETESIQHKPIRIIFSTIDGKGKIVNGVDTLLPFKFSKEDLNA